MDPWRCTVSNSDNQKARRDIRGSGCRLDTGRSCANLDFLAPRNNVRRSSMGVTGLNLHVFPYVTDIGYSPVVAATVMSVIASMQLASPLVWGLVAERMDHVHCGDAAFRDSGNRTQRWRSRRKYILRLCRVFSIWHRIRRQYGLARNSMGQLFRPPLSWNGSRPRPSHIPGPFGNRTAFLRIPFRYYARIRRIVHDFRLRAGTVGVFKPAAAAAR